MSALVALDWDAAEVRVVLASTRGRELRIEQSFVVAWPDNVAGNDAAQRGDRLKQVLRERGVARSDVLVTLGRSAVELKQLQLPPAPDEELPELVRFAAQRELHAAADAPLDYLPTPAAAGEPRTVLAAAIEAKQVDDVRQTCEAAGLRLRRLLLRPCAAASLVARKRVVDGPNLLVDLGGDEVELTALDSRRVVLLRSTRLPTSAEQGELVRMLSGELRRTLASVQFQLGGRAVERITLCGDRSAAAAIVERLATELVAAGISTPIDAIDPRSCLPPESIPADAPFDPRGRNAALLGALADEAEGVAPDFDFVNPRRPAPPPDIRRRVLIGATAATVVIGVVWGTVLVKLRGLDSRIRDLQTQSAGLDKMVKVADDVEQRADDIGHWLKTDVLWLDELARLSELLPPPPDALLTNLRCGAHAQGGETQLAGLVREASVVDALDHALRDATHIVEGKGRQHDDTQEKYPWRFKTDVIVKTEAPASAPSPPSAGGAK